MRWTPGASHRRILAFPTSNARHLFAVGGYGGGKSAAVVRGCITHVSAEYQGEKGAAVAASKVQLDEMSGELQAACADLGLGLHQNERAWRVTPFGGGEPNIIIPTVFGDPGAAGPARRLQGTNLAFAMVEEAPNMGEQMRRMLISRLRAVPWPLCWWSMNPDSPLHPFLVDMIQNPRIAGLYVRVPLSDNPSLPPTYVDDLRAAHPHQWQQRRYIDGYWAGATGLVWPGAWQHADVGGNVTARDERWANCTVGVDWATKRISHAVLIGSWGGGHHVIAEWHHDARIDGELSEPDQAYRIIEAFAPWRPTRYVVDRTSHGLILALRERALGAHVGPGQLDISLGVDNVSILLADDWLTVDPACGYLIAQMSIYSWPPLAEQPRSGPVHPDKRRAGGADAVEALRYACEALPVNFASPRPRVDGAAAQRRPIEPMLTALR